MTAHPTVYTANQPLMLGGQIYMWHRYLKSEVLVHMLEAQFVKFGHQSRIEFVTSAGGKQWFIAPLRDRAYQPLNKVVLATPEGTSKKLAATLRGLYPDTLCKEIEFRERIIKRFNDWAKSDLASLNIATTSLIWNFLALSVADPTGEPFSRCQAQSIDVLPVRPEDPSKWVAELGRAINCSTYLGGGTAMAAYINPEDFSSRGISLATQDYKMPPYFVTDKKGRKALQADAYVSILDPIFRLGREETLRLLGEHHV